MNILTKLNKIKCQQAPARDDLGIKKGERNFIRAKWEQRLKE